MRIEDTNTIELGVASTDTRGSTMGFSDGETGLMWHPGLYDD
ncbi:hypothetical protein [Sphingomonas qomolangmaensis]|uniref:Uncharacterized protein n=1 Tax=Sphingomonas qomolangmaensis TaxID=2918765 RepID=A0ABY5L9I0_9SPHN|nr:hypothetical protein [Sphingomonas qomolangmaensis]UUL82517.1 hypothetical protein NMP03_15320 [Sphingomonas qomolangmaensis]